MKLMEWRECALAVDGGMRMMESVLEARKPGG